MKFIAAFDVIFMKNVHVRQCFIVQWKGFMVVPLNTPKTSGTHRLQLWG